MSGSDADLPGQSLTYTISGGADASLFTLDPVTGELRFTSLRNFELPDDLDADGTYEVLVRVSDGQLWSEQLVRVAVVDQNDQPVANADFWSFDEDHALNDSVSGNDSDEDWRRARFSNS